MNPNKFLTLLMGECWHEWEWKPKDGDIHIYECKCGLRVGGRPQKPDHLSNPLPVIRWMEKEMPLVLDNYLQGLAYATWREDQTGYPHLAVFKAHLNLRNLVDFLWENPELLEKCDQMNCQSPECRENSECGGTGKITHPALAYLRNIKEEG